jgi:hypothetical protein
MAGAVRPPGDPCLSRCRRVRRPGDASPATGAGAAAAGGLCERGARARSGSKRGSCTGPCRRAADFAAARVRRSRNPDRLDCVSLGLGRVGPRLDPCPCAGDHGLRRGGHDAPRRALLGEPSRAHSLARDLADAAGSGDGACRGPRFHDGRFDVDAVRCRVERDREWRPPRCRIPSRSACPLVVCASRRRQRAWARRRLACSGAFRGAAVSPPPPLRDACSERSPGYCVRVRRERRDAGCSPGDPRERRRDARRYRLHHTTRRRVGAGALRTRCRAHRARNARGGRPDRRGVAAGVPP